MKPENKLFIAIVMYVIVFMLGVTYGQANAQEFDLKYNPPKGEVLSFGNKLSGMIGRLQLEPETLVIVNTNEPYKNERASYAYEISGKDKDFVLTMNAECSSWNCGLHGLKYAREGQLWSDGFQCGISAYYHTNKFVKAKELHNKGNWQEILHICHALYSKGTRFYGFDHRHARGHFITFNQ